MGGTLKYAWVCAVALVAISAAHAATTKPSAAELLKPSVITLHYHDAPLMDVLEDFAKQAGAEMGIHNKITADFAATRRVSIDVDHASFWQALREVSKVSELHPLTYFFGRDIVLEPDHMPQGQSAAGFNLFSDKAQEVGPFWVVPLDAAQERHVAWQGGDEDRRSLILKLAAIPEPRLRFVGRAKPDWVVQCLDERGNTISPLALKVDKDSVLFEDSFTTWWWPLTASLDEPTHMGGMIADLKGIIKADLITQSDVIEAKNLDNLNGVIDTAGRYAIWVKSVKEKPADRVWEMEVSIRGADTLTDELVSILQGIELYDDAGNQLDHGPATGHGQSNGELLLAISYWPYRETRWRGGACFSATITGDFLGAPQRLRWIAAKQAQEIAVPFEIQNLPLPHRVTENLPQPATHPAEPQTRPTTLPDLQPAVITMHYKAAPLQTVLDDFAKQAGGDIGQQEKRVVDFAKDKRISLDLDHVSFWKGAAALCKASGLSLAPESRGYWLLSPDPSRIPPAALDNPRGQIIGPFAFLPRYCDQKRKVNYAGQFTIDSEFKRTPDADTSSLEIAMFLFAEPKYLSAILPGRSLKCHDDKGHYLSLAYTEPGSAVDWALYADLLEPAELGGRMTDLKLTTDIRAYTKSQVLEVANIRTAQNVVLKCNGNTLTVHKLTKPGANWTLSVKLTGPLASADRDNIEKSLELVDGAGRSIQHGGMVVNPPNGVMELIYLSRNIELPADQMAEKLRWIVNEDSPVFTVPFELHDLPLPGPK